MKKALSDGEKLQTVLVVTHEASETGAPIFTKSMQGIKPRSKCAGPSTKAREFRR